MESNMEINKSKDLFCELQKHYYCIKAFISILHSENESFFEVVPMKINHYRL